MNREVLLSLPEACVLAGLDVADFPGVWRGGGYLFAQPSDFVVSLPLEVGFTHGDKLAFTCASDLWRPVYKFSDGCNCKRPPPGGGGKVGRLCFACSFEVSALVQCGGEALTMGDALLVGDGNSSAREAAMLLLLRHPAWPSFFAPSAQEAPAGAPSNAGRAFCVKKPALSGPLAGVHMGIGFLCSAPAPDGGSCGAAGWLCSESEQPDLFARFYGDHHHAAGCCRLHGAVKCMVCPDSSRPPPQATGFLTGALASARLHEVQSYASGHDAGNSLSPAAMFSVSVSLMSRMALLGGVRTQCGRDVENWKRIMASNRQRVATRTGTAAPATPSNGGPETSLGRTWENLVCFHLHLITFGLPTAKNADGAANEVRRTSVSWFWPRHVALADAWVLVHCCVLSLPRVDRAGPCCKRRMILH